jgi:hypothetical protein
MDGADGGGFLSRWARRKQEAKTASPAEPAPTPEAPAAVVEAEPEPLPLPSLDDVLPGGDVSAFFQKHVPDALRNAALRKLWTTDPAIRDFIEMADYQWDFNNPDSIPGWSSKLADVDVKVMAERILNAVSTPEAPREPVRTAAERSDGILETERGSLREITENIADSEAFGEPEALAATPLPPDVAVQDSPLSSSGYARVSRRGGGALPT